MDQKDVHALMRKVHFFNHQFHLSENKVELKAFHELMRQSKNRCQLMLLRFAKQDLVWVKPDISSSHGEWLIGAHGLDAMAACHIPRSILINQLDAQQLKYWNII